MVVQETQLFRTSTYHNLMQTEISTGDPMSIGPLILAQTSFHRAATSITMPLLTTSCVPMRSGALVQ